MSSFISGWGTAVPEGIITNDDIAARVDTSDDWIVERTGIRNRRVAGPDESTATLGTTAAANAIKRAGLTPTDIDLMIVATATPERLIPHTGADIGERLGLRCGSFDLNAACSGFVYSTVVAHGMIATGMQHVLVVGAEILTRIVDPDDRGTCILFGDAAGAAVVSATSDNALLGFDLGCDGSAADILMLPAGGSRLPTSPQTVADGDHFIKMQGQEVFKRAVRAIADSARTALDRAGMTIDDIDWFVPHQANLRIIESGAQRLGIDMQRVIVNIAEYGNTSSASIPLALFEAVEAGRVRDGDVVLVSGFGAGMTWASAVLRWGTP